MKKRRRSKKKMYQRIKAKKWKCVCVCVCYGIYRFVYGPKMVFRGATITVHNRRTKWMNYRRGEWMRCVCASEIVIIRHNGRTKVNQTASGFIHVKFKMNILSRNGATKIHEIHGTHNKDRTRAERGREEINVSKISLIEWTYLAR